MDEESPLFVETPPTQSQTQSHNNKGLNHSRDVHILSWSFLLIFLAYGAAQNLQTTLNTDGDLGSISLGILYTSFTVFSLLSSLVVQALGSKKSILLGTTGYWLFIAANFRPTWYTMVPVSLYLGFCASIIWVGQGTYLTSTAQSLAKDHKLHEGTIIGHFNGEFWGLFASHQVVGNLISLALLKKGKPISILMSKMRGLDGNENLLWLKMEGTTGTTLLFAIFLSSMILGTILMCFLRNRDGKEEKRSKDSSIGFISSVISLSKTVITPLFDVRLLLIIPLIVYSGLQQAFICAEFTKYIVLPSLDEAGVGGAMAIFGVFDALCSVAAGRLTSGLTSITFIVSGGALIQAVILIGLLLNVSSRAFGTVYPLLIAALWGIGDGVFNTQLNALLAMLFKHDTEGSFAQLKLWQSGAIAVVFFIGPYITLKCMLEIMIVALFISVVGFLFLTLKVEKAFSTDTAN